MDPGGSFPLYFILLQCVFPFHFKILKLSGNKTLRMGVVV